MSQIDPFAAKNCDLSLIVENVDCLRRFLLFQMSSFDQDGANAQAWALSFYLSETQPRLYAQYLTKTAERPMFSQYSPVERMADFQASFGNEMKIFESKFLRYMEEVK